MLKKTLRILLIILNGFLALTAFGGGIGLWTGAARPPLEMLRGSPFPDYTIPALALFVLVGGSALVATILLVRRHPLAAIVSIAVGSAIIIFEIVEVLVIGSDPGIARNLQIVYFSLGLLILVLAIVLWLAERREG